MRPRNSGALGASVTASSKVVRTDSNLATQYKKKNDIVDKRELNSIKQSKLLLPFDELI
jgi:hypothetical protein